VALLDRPLQSALAALEGVLNRTAQASTPARQQLARLQGRAFAVKLEGPDLRVVLAAGEAGLTLTAGDAPADTTVSGTPLALLAMLAPQADLRLRSSGVRIEGDAETAQAFRDLLQHARPDLEAELARHVGDAPAHHAARFARGVFDFGRRVARSLSQDTAEYLTEEAGHLPPRAEAEGFLDAVDHLREDVDRAEARLRVLEARRAPRPAVRAS
jgi:ubiquinone biosynthesis accessory factor UbiJ